MKYSTSFRILFACLLLCTIAACNNQATTQKAVDTKRDTASSATAKNDSLVNDACAGAVPDHSLVDSLKYPDRQFKLNDRIGYDRFTTTKGDTIYIEHSNCEYAICKISIVTHHPAHDTADVKYWAKAASDIFTEIGPAIDEVADMDSANYYLKNHYERAASDKAVIREEIIYRRVYDFLSIVTFNNIEQINDRYVLTFILSRGPL